MRVRFSLPNGGHVSRFMRQTGGNVAMLFGLTLVPMLGAIGLAVDFGSVLVARNKAQVAADAAALQASGVARELIKASDGSDAAVAAAIAEAKRRAEGLFTAHATQSGLDGATATVSVTRAGQKITTNVAYSTGTTTHFARLFGQNTYTAEGAAGSSSSLPTYSDVHIALDISQSMGIAATQDEMNKLYKAEGKLKKGGTRPITCVFGCHTAEVEFSESFSTVAARYGIRLRIDVLRDATQRMIETAEMDAESAPVYRIGLYAMGMNPAYSNPKLISLADLSNDFAAIKTAAGKIALGPAPNGKSDSYISENVEALGKIIPASGDGSEQKKQSKKYAFIITDGARDVTTGVKCTWATSDRCVSTIDVSVCDAMKQKGITVGVLYTTYVPIRPIRPKEVERDWYDVQIVKPGLATSIAPALQKCASPGWFYEASDAAAIDVAMQKMFAQTTLAPALTY